MQQPEKEVTGNWKDNFAYSSEFTDGSEMIHITFAVVLVQKYRWKCYNGSGKSIMPCPILLIQILEMSEEHGLC